MFEIGISFLKTINTLFFLIITSDKSAYCNELISVNLLQCTKTINYSFFFLLHDKVTNVKDPVKEYDLIIQ